MAATTAAAPALPYSAGQIVSPEIARDLHAPTDQSPHPRLAAGASPMRRGRCMPRSRSARRSSPGTPRTLNRKVEWEALRCFPQDVDHAPDDRQTDVRPGCSGADAVAARQGGCRSEHGRPRHRALRHARTLAGPARLPARLARHPAAGDRPTGAADRARRHLARRHYRRSLRLLSIPASAAPCSTRRRASRSRSSTGTAPTAATPAPSS